MAALCSLLLNVHTSTQSTPACWAVHQPREGKHHAFVPQPMPSVQVHSIVSKLMMDDKLHGSWDQPTSTIVMHNAEPSRLQSLAMQFADKAGTMVDLNERALTLRTGGMRDSEDDMGRGYQEGGGGRR